MQIFKMTYRPCTQAEVFSRGLRARRCTSTSALASTIARQISSNHCGQGEKPIPSIISQGAGRCSSWTVVHYSTRDCSELIWVYSKKGTSCITGKWWPNSIPIKKCISFRTVPTILSFRCIWCRFLNSAVLKVCILSHLFQLLFPASRWLSMFCGTIIQTATVWTKKNP